MIPIKVPQPPKSAFNKDRPLSTLLRSHVEHLQRAEFRLPANLQTNIYINAIKTEGEAADYIKLVTERLHAAHGHEIAPKTKGKTMRGIAIAAAAAAPKRTRKSAGKTRATSKGGSKRKK